MSPKKSFKNPSNLKFYGLIKILISLAAIFLCTLWSKDIALAYLHRAHKILRKLFVNGKL